MSARYQDVHFADGMPRLYTSNDDSPNSFHPGFPPMLYTMSAESVQALPNHSLALLKRFCFCSVTTGLIPEHLRTAFEQSRNSSVRVAASALFSGANAIP